MKLPKVRETAGNLEAGKVFKKWNEKHSRSFLSHFFCPLDANYQALGKCWEIGYFNPDDEKITVFLLEEEAASIKEEDEVFKKEQEKVEKLELDKVKISFEEAREIFQSKAKEFFPKAILGNGFVILQKLQEKNLWNFTFITKDLKFVNIKINAEDGKVESQQTVELLQKEGLLRK